MRDVDLRGRTASFHVARKLGVVAFFDHQLLRAHIDHWFHWGYLWLDILIGENGCHFHQCDPGIRSPPLSLSGVRLRKVNKRSQLALSASITFWEILKPLIIMVAINCYCIVESNATFDNKQKAQVD